jgi:putative transposase
VDPVTSEKRIVTSLRSSDIGFSLSFWLQEPSNHRPTPSAVLTHHSKKSKAYQHARTLPKQTPERTEAFKAARAAQGFTEAALQRYAKDCRHASGWIEEHLDAPVCQQLATRVYRAALRIALGRAQRVRFKGRNQLGTVEGKSNETSLIWRTDRVVWRGLTLRAYLPRGTQQDPVLAHGLAAPVKYV